MHRTEEDYLKWLCTEATLPQAMASIESCVLLMLHALWRDEIQRVEVAMHLRDHIRDGAADLRQYLDSVRKQVRKRKAAS